MATIFSIEKLPKTWFFFLQTCTNQISNHKAKICSNKIQINGKKTKNQNITISILPSWFDSTRESYKCQRVRVWRNRHLINLSIFEIYFLIRKICHTLFEGEGSGYRAFWILSRPEAGFEVGQGEGPKIQKALYLEPSALQ